MNELPWQSDVKLDVFEDTDFAGVSPLGGAFWWGAATSGLHLIRHWSSTQKAVTLSSAEAELCGIFKGTTDALGIQSVGRDLGLSMILSMHTDSAAAVGICKRASVGRVRHLVVGQLWIQEGLRRGDFRLFKVRGDANTADALTKHLPRDVLDRHVGAFSLKRLVGIHGAEGAVAVEASSVKLVPRSATTWLELSNVRTRLLSSPSLAAVVMMLLAMSTARLS